MTPEEEDAVIFKICHKAAEAMHGYNYEICFSALAQMLSYSITQCVHEEDSAYELAEEIANAIMDLIEEHYEHQSRPRGSVAN